MRRSDPEKDRELLEIVCDRIKRKIGWPEEETDDWEFLMAFYGAQRGRLEHKALFGVRQENKRK